MSDVAGPIDTPTETEARVGVGLSLTPRRQSRLSIFFRFIIAIPFMFFLAIFQFFIYFVVVAAWFIALFTGRVPEGLQKLITLFVQYSLELMAYTLLLTSRLPGLENRPARGPRPVLDIDQTDLNRMAVLFRYFLAIPAAILGSLFAMGTYFYVVVMWFAGVFTGRTPESLHQAAALYARYQTRYYAYFLLLSPTQPFSGMFGDVIVEPEAAGLAPATDGEAAVESGDVDNAAEETLDASSPWRVQTFASTLAKVAVGIGAVAWVISVALIAVLIANAPLNKIQASVNVEASYLEVASNYQSYTTTLAVCTFTNCAVNAANKADQNVTAIIANFQKDVSRTGAPQPLYDNYVSQLNIVQEDFAQAAGVTSVEAARQGQAALTSDMQTLQSDAVALSNAFLTA